MTLTRSSAALDYVRVPVYAKESGSVVDPTADTVEMAFLTTGAAPDSGDWETASWETDSTTSPPTYYARCLVGTGGTVALAAGRYRVWVRVTDSPEIPVLDAGIMVVE